MDAYPPELTYNNINPKGFFSTFKQWSIQPLASGGVFWPGQNIKILIQSIISGVMDPYRSHLEFQVQVDSQYLPVGGLQVDSSAQSFIEQLVINSRNKQIQRIPEYSTLAAWLTDCGLSQMYAQGRQTEGLGYTNVQSLSSYSKQANSFPNVVTYGTDSQIGQSTTVNGAGTLFPTQASNMFNRFQHVDIPGSTPRCITGKNLKGHIGMTNSAIWQDSPEPIQYVAQNPGRNFVYQSAMKQSGYMKNMRAQYAQATNNLMYADSTSSLSSYQVNVKPAVFNGNPIAKWDTGVLYQTQIPKTIDYQLWTGTTTPKFKQTVPNTTAIHGFSSLYSPNFCKGVRQPMISPTIPQCQMQNGLILPSKVPVSKRTFKVPIISAILGLLIPQDQFVLLPIKALNQILMEFVVDKYAMFTTGYNDISQYDDLGMKVQQQRAFIIKRVIYKMHTYQFYSPQIDNYLVQSLSDRILLNCNMWTLGNQYQVIRGQNLNNSWPIACTSQALNQIVVLFVPLDYQHYSFCRRHFRISNNITKFQLRVNMDYYPSQPLLGNGGNPCQMQGVDNSAFVQQIYWSNNFMFNKVNPWPRINAYNFAINERCYDITKQTAMYADPARTQKTTYLWDTNTINVDTALGMPSVHQNRYVGKAGYVYGFQPYAHSAYHLTGLDCRTVRQFDLLLSTNPQDNFPRQQTLYVFTRSSVIVQFSSNGVNVYGR